MERFTIVIRYSPGVRYHLGGKYAKNAFMSQDTEPGSHRILLIGGSSGSLEPTRRILSALPAELPVAVFVVVHLAASQARPDALFAKHTSLKVMLAEDGRRFSPGEVYVAPADRHLAIEGGNMRVYHGPRENNARPSVDVLFRAAAVHHGNRVIGVLLSGALHDGALGVSAVERCGGVTLVQAPGDAANPTMPTSALEMTRVDHCVPAIDMPALLINIVGQPVPESVPVPEELRLEARLALASADPRHPAEVLGEPVPITCPECGGPLSQVPHGTSYGYRCHVGHSYSPSAMLAEHTLALERALWVAFRTLKERGVLLTKLIADAHANGHSSVDGFEERLRELETHATSIYEAIAALSEPPLQYPAEARL
jgi:two-component system, chemotaxis family, protein-glutamate methylesterase/glutaminase